MSRDGWHKRLLDAIDADGRSDRAISTAANLGINYVSQMRGSENSDPKMPTVEAFLRVCQALGKSVTEILTGSSMSREAEEMLELWASLNDEQRRSFLQMLRSLQPSDEAPEEPGSSAQ